MPIYCYKCRACGHEEERIVNMAARDEQFCECGEQLDSVPGIPARRTTGFAGKGGGLPANWGTEDRA